MISDFGLSKMEGKGDVMSTACGTPGYVGKNCVCVCFSMSPTCQLHNSLKHLSLAYEHACLHFPRAKYEKI